MLPGRWTSLLPLLVVALLVLPLLSAAVATEASDPSSTHGRQQTIPSCLSTPVVDGFYNSSAEWVGSLNLDIGVSGRAAELYVCADGMSLYFLADLIQETTPDPTSGPLAADGATEYFTIIIDGDNDGEVTYAQNQQGFKPPDQGGQNVDHGVLVGKNLTTRWVGQLYTGQGLTFATQWSYADIFAYNYNGSANFGTSHLIAEVSIPYDGPGDVLGGSIWKGFVKGLYIVGFDSALPAGDQMYASWPQPPPAGLAGGFDPMTLPQELPHIRITDPAVADGPFEVGTAVVVTTEATDDSVGTLTYQWDLDGTPIAGATAATYPFDPTAAGFYDLQVTVTDTQSNAESADMVMEWIPQETGPSTVSTEPPAGAVEGVEGADLPLSLTYQDLNLGQSDEAVAVSWTLNGAAVTPSKVSGFQVDPTTRRTTYTFSTDYEMAGTYAVSVLVTDSYLDAGLTTSATWSVTVANTNRPPKIETATPAGNAIALKELESVQFEISATDPDSDTLEYAWTFDDLPQPLSAGALSFTYLSDLSSAGPHTVRAEVSDGTDEVNRTWSVTVDNLNQAPRIVSLSPEGAVVLDEGSSQTFSVVAADADEDSLTYLWRLNELDIESATTPTFVFTTAFTGPMSAGGYTLEVIVKDGHVSTPTSWEIEVRNVDRPPVVVWASPQEGSTFPLGSRVNFIAGESKDPDGHALTYAWDFGDGSKAVEAVLTHEYRQPDTYQVTLTVSDGGTPIVLSRTITIEAAVVSVTFIKAEPTTAKEGSSIHLEVTVRNSGNLAVDGVAVTLVIGSSVSAQLFANLTPQADQVLTFEWKARPGTHKVSASIAPKDGLQIDTSGTPPSVTLTIEALHRTDDSGQPSLLTSPVVLGGIVGLLVVLIVVALIAARRVKAKRYSEGLMASVPAPAAPMTYQTDYQARALSQETFARALQTTQTPAERSTASSKARVCPHCKAEVFEESADCPFCYKPMVVAPPPPKPVIAPPAAVPSVPVTPKGPTCPACHEPVEAGWKLCPFCDHALGEPSAPSSAGAAGTKSASTRPTSAKTHCPACNEEVERDWKICPFCDNELKGSSPTPPRSTRPSGTAVSGPSPTKGSASAAPSRPSPTNAASPSPRGAAPIPAVAPPAASLAGAFTSRLATLQAALERAEAGGKPRKDVRNFLTLAQRNHGSGKLDKATEYLDKAQKALEPS